jgi:hypothetical protein
LELYALHKQAVSGDAPTTLATATAAERAKYQAWRAKAGLSSAEAMALYIQESDRQMRVYGNATNLANTPLNTPAALLEDGSAMPPNAQPRGLAAIPLLCAAASETRSAYLRRLANTQAHMAWWSRQEPLCASPGSLGAVPETLLIGLASIVEYISLSVESWIPMIPAPVIQSWLWPWHNALLALWMGLIVVLTAWTSLLDLAHTLLWGSRRTGLSLSHIWKDQVQWNASSVRILTEGHQPLSARVVGLALWPVVGLVQLSNWAPSGAPRGVAYGVVLFLTWWYWMLTLPWLAVCMMFVALLLGNCFALIEFAGV